MIIKITSSAIRNIWNTFLFIFLLFFFLYILLLKGFFIEKLILPFSSIEGLYIKLDKKFILRVNNIVVKKREKSLNAKEEITEIINKFKYFKILFKELDINNIKFENNNIGFYYFNNIFQFNSKHLFLRSLINIEENSLNMDIIDLKLKEYNLSLWGKLNANLINKSGYFDGNFEIFNIKGDAKLFLNQNRVNYYLSTDKFDSLEPLMGYLEKKVKIHPLISAWIYKKITAKQYKLKQLQGSYNIKTNNFYPSKIKAIAEAENVDVKFHRDIHPVKVKKVTLLLTNDRLRFKLYEPFYYDKNLTGSFVTIFSLTDLKKSGIEIVINTTSPLDKSIHKILKAYKINLPLLQKKGVTKGMVLIKIPQFKLSKLDVKGEFTTKKSTFALKNIPFKTKKAKVFLDNGFVTLKDTNILYDKLFDINGNGVFDIKGKSFNGTALINSFKIKQNKFDLLNIKNIKTPVSVTMGKNKTVILLPTLGAKAYLSNKKNLFFIKYLSKIYPYSPLLKKYKVKKGSFDIQTKDFSSYNIYAHLQNINLPLIKNGKKTDDLKLNITLKPNLTLINDMDNSLIIKILGDNLIVKLKDTDFILNKSDLTKKSDLDFKKSAILATDSNIIFSKNTTLYCSSYNAIIKKDNINFVCKQGIDKISFIKNGKDMKIEAKNISNYFINSLGGKKIFENGRFSFKTKGDLKNLRGKFSIQNATLKELKVFNNLMAFINTIPSLLFLQNPNFSDKGYKIKNGEIEFIKIDNILTLTRIVLNGYSADIFGKGYVDLKQNHIDLNLQISTLQNIDKIIKHIPLVGYIILGKDGKNSVSLKIEGNLSDPTVQTYLIKDIFQMPFNILKRTLNIPMQIFDKK